MSIFGRGSLAGKAIALAMGALLAISSPAQALAQAEAAGKAGKYVSDVRVGVGKTDEEAVGYLEGEGYTVMGYLGDHARKGAKGDYARLADLNEGGDAWVKSTRKVYLGYKTTDNAAEAVTDLAVMGMDGGYSFSSYAQLMDKYRDETVRPLQEQVMRMVAEYRENAESDDAGRQARAEVARAQLNKIVDDDTGERLGDLLLKETSQEMGATPSTMGAEEAKAWREANPGVLDLECALMQGSADVVLQVERLLASACDTTGTTWLQRLSELGPDGLEERFADLPPTDARREMDSLYQDAATKLAEGWADLGTVLAGSDERIGSYYDDSGDDGGGDADEGDDGGDGEAEETGGEPADDAGEPLETPEGEDEAALPDLGDLLDFDVSEPEEREVSAEDVPEVMDDIVSGEEAALETIEAAQELSADSLYQVLRALPFGDGTLYDYFCMGGAEAAADGAYALYPIVAVLTDGQLASVDFQPLSSLALQGAITDAACEAIAWGDSNLLEAVGNASEVSLYQGVRREIFSDLSALTSEAMRKNALNSEGSIFSDLWTHWKFTAMSALGFAVTGVAAFFAPKISNTFLDTAALAKATDVSEHIDDLKRTKDAFQKFASKKHFTIKSFSMRRYREIDGSGAYYVNMTSESNKVYKIKIDDSSISRLQDYDSSMQSLDDIDDAIKKAEEPFNKTETHWSGLKKGFAVAAVILAVATMVSLTYEIYDYFNVDYTPIPKYMVDERDVTEVADDGTVRVVRNDAAYYEVARTNRKSDADHYEALRDFADLNGDGGKGWVALYVGRDTTLQPILAESLGAVVGTATVPDGYATGIHDFGTEGATNLTDMRYSYNDGAGGIYAYFAREVPEGAPAETASAFGGGSASPVAFAVIGLGVGAAAGSAVTYAVLKRRKEQ